MPRPARSITNRSSLLGLALLLAALLAAAAILASFGMGLLPGQTTSRPTTGAGQGQGAGAAAELDLLIVGGQVLDGTGSAAVRADVGIKGDRIVAVGNLSKSRARRVINAAGMIVAPGFINVHSHTDDGILENRDAWAALRQGITTEIVGQDGRAPSDLAAYGRTLTAGGIGVNLALLAGHGSIRESVMGAATRAPTPPELESMRARVRQAVRDGAFGLSVGLEYVPGKFATAAELESLAGELAPSGGVLAAHLRNEGGALVQAVEEVLSIAAKAGVTLNIAHLKAAGRGNWPVFQGILDRMDAARRSGQTVYADIYPYQAPDYTCRLRLADARAVYRPEDLLIRKAAGTDFAGQTVDQIATKLGTTAQAAIDRILARDPEAVAVGLIISEDNIAAALARPFTVISSDDEAYPVFAAGDARSLSVHPRAHGTFPTVLGRFVRERKTLTLETAVFKMTGLPARMYGVADRGLVQKGCFADLVIFDRDKIAGRATFVAPQLPPDGIVHVIVNGVAVISGGEPVLTADALGRQTGPRAGRVLRKGQ
jgi:N-acyl-D-amino-acid deacylase